MTQITENAQETDIIKLLETQFKGSNMQIQAGQLGLASIQANGAGQHREIIKALLASDPQTALVTITCLDLGENLGVYYHMRTSQGYLTITVSYTHLRAHETRHDLVC